MHLAKPSALAMLLLFLALPVPAEAQAEVRGVRVIEDPAGDLAISNPANSPVPIQHESMGYLDILAVDVQEEADILLVTLWIASFPAEPTVPFLQAAFHHVRFVHQDVGYGVGFVLGADTAQGAWLEASHGGGPYEEVMDLDLVTDAATGRLTATVPRDVIPDADGSPPFPGRSLTEFTAYSRGLGFNGFEVVSGVGVGGVYPSDEAAAAAGLAFAIQHGVRQDGTARLWSERPFRASNGEEATFAFEVKAANLGPEAGVFRFEAADVPAGWHVEFPEPEVELAASASLPIQVLAHVPFSHQHGRIAAFTVELHSVADPGSVGRVKLGLHYTDPAQPAGHHPTLYLHSYARGEFETAIGTVSSGNGAQATMNTQEESARDDRVEVTGRFSATGNDLTVSSFQWVIPLSPQLQMGLDFDMAGKGSVTIPMATTLPMPKARLGGSILAGTSELGEPFADLSGGTVLATIPETAPVEVGAKSSHLFEAEVLPTLEADYLAYDPTRNLFLVIEVTFERVALITAPESPALQPGGSLTLPLLEYADRIPRRSVVEDATAGEGTEAGSGEDGEKKAPGAGALLALLAAIGLAALRRRSRA